MFLEDGSFSRGTTVEKNFNRRMGPPMWYLIHCRKKSPAVMCATWALLQSPGDFFLRISLDGCRHATIGIARRGFTALTGQIFDTALVHSTILGSLGFHGIKGDIVTLGTQFFGNTILPWMNGGTHDVG